MPQNGANDTQAGGAGVTRIVAAAGLAVLLLLIPPVTPGNADLLKQSFWSRLSTLQSTVAASMSISGAQFTPAGGVAALKNTFAQLANRLASETDTSTQAALLQGEPVVAGFALTGVDPKTGRFQGRERVTGAPIGVPLLIVGSGFSSNPADNAVFFSGVRAPVMTVPATGVQAIAVVVPPVGPKAEWPRARTADVIVTNRGVPSRPVTFGITGFASESGASRLGAAASAAAGDLARRLVEDEKALARLTANLNCDHVTSYGDFTPDRVAFARSACEQLKAQAPALLTQLDTLLTSATLEDLVLLDALAAALLEPWTDIITSLESTSTGAFADTDGDGLPNFLDCSTLRPAPTQPSQAAQLSGLETSLKWTSPPGVTQAHLQVVPRNEDGPGINLILGAIASYDVRAPVFGAGPYVILPGATYTWRVRTTCVEVPAGEMGPVWSAWSEDRTFTTRRPNAGTLQLLQPIDGATTNDATPTLQWKNSATDEFYYEVQLSADRNFNTDPGTATASVLWNLVHGGQSDPIHSWTVPDASALMPGTYHWRVRQRLQATPAGTAEPGIVWGPPQQFVVR